MLTTVAEGLLVHGKYLFSPVGNFVIDANEIAECAVISHAHGDHAIPGHERYICTEGTKMLLQARYRRLKDDRFRIVNFFESILYNDVRITFLPAQHILGSAMILMQRGYQSVLYTGDFRFEEDYDFDKYQCHSLVTESTFAHKNILHADAVSEIKKLNDVQQPVVLGVYAMGKAQRLTQLINEHWSMKTVYVDQKIIPFHHVYEKSGIDLGKWQPYNRKKFEQDPHSVLLTTPHNSLSYHDNYKVKCAYASGHHQKYGSNILHLNISDHADWKQLTRFIDKLQPEKVFTLHGNGDELQEHYLNSNIEITVM